MVPVQSAKILMKPVDLVDLGSAAKSAAAQIDAIMVPLHQRRVAELGVDDSGLFEHYKRILDSGHIADRVADLALMIGQSLPRFDKYLVLRSGLGELAFVFAAMGLEVMACEANARRFTAVEASLRALLESDPGTARRVSALLETVPAIEADGSVLCVAHQLMGISPDQEGATLERLSQFDAVLIEPRIFLRLRESLEEQEDAVELLRCRGFTQIRSFRRLGLVYCAKADVPPPPTVIVKSELPAVDNIVNALKSMSNDETGLHEIRLGAVGIRDYPYPFAAALAVATGVTWQSRDHYLKLRDVLCGTAETASGPGLGLEIGGAFTLVREADAVRAAFSASSSRPGEAKDDEAILLDLGRSGWIDTLRSVRMDDVALRKLERLAIDGLAPSIGIDVDGEAPGLRFVSHAGLLDLAKFGDHVDFGNQARLAEAAAAYPWEQWQHFLPASREMLVARFNSILQLDQDTAGRTPFKRFRGMLRPTWTAFPSEIRTDRLDALERQRAAAIVELDTSIFSLVGASESRDGHRPLDLAEMFDQHAVQCWMDIAARASGERLLVATTARLLNWLWLRRHLVIRMNRNSGRWVVSLSATDGRVLDDATLNGLALIVPEAAPEVVVHVDGSDRSLTVRRAPDPAVAGHHAVYLPWRGLVWPLE